MNHTCSVEFPPDIHEKAEATALEDFPDIDKMSPEEIKNLVHDLRLRLAETEIMNEVLIHACEEQESEIEKIRESEREIKPEKKEIQDKNRLLSAMYENLPVGIFILDGEGNVLLINPVAKKIWGGDRPVRLEEFGTYKGWWPGTTEQLEPEEWAGARAITKGESIIGEEVEIEGFDGRRKIIRNSAIPLKNERGEITGAIVLNEDITAQKLADLELLEYRDHLENLVEKRTIQLSKDISKRKKLLERIIASEELFKGFFKQTPAALSLFNSRLEFEKANMMAVDMLGYYESELIGRRLSDLDIGDYAIYSEKILRRVLGTGISEKDIEMSMPSRDHPGETMHLLTTVFPLRLPKRKCAVGVVTLDITERRRIEDELRRERVILSTVLNAVPAGIVLADAEGNFTYSNPGVEEILGGPLVGTAQTPGKGTYELMKPDRTPLESEELPLIQSLSKDERVYDVEMVIKRADESEVCVLADSIPLHDENGNVTGAVVSLLDITEQKKTEEALRESNDRLQFIIENSPDNIFIQDIELKYVWIGRPAYPLAPEDYLGHTDWDLVPSEYAARLTEIKKRVLEQGTGTSIEIQVPLKDELRHFLAIYEPRRNPEGEVIGIAGYVSDITERKLIEERLRVSEERLRLAIEAAGIGVWDLDFSTDIATRTLRHDQIWGYEELQEEWGYEIAMSHVVKEDYPIIEEAYRKAQETGLLSHENRVIWPDGSIHWIHAYGRFLYDEEGKPVRVLGIVSDITDRKRAEEELQRAYGLIKSITEGTDDRIAAVDNDFRFIFFNEAYRREFKELWGSDIKVGDSMPELIAPWPEDRRKAMDIWKRALDGESFKIVVDFGPSEEQKHIYDLRFNPIYDEQGNRIGAAHSFRDVTEQMRVQQTLRESEERFRTLADNISQFAWMTDKKGNFVWYNKRWYEYTGTTYEEMKGWGWKKVHHPHHVQRVVEKMSHSFKMGEIWEDTFPLRGKDGQYRWFLSRAVPITDKEGKIVRWFGTNTDITELLEAQERADEYARHFDNQRAQLAAANKELESFSYSISHDLRAPLRSLDGFSILLLEDYADKVDENGKYYLNRIRAAANRMGKLIDDILQLSRTTRADIHYRTVDLSKNALTIANELRRLEPDREVEIIIQDGITVEGDRDLLILVLQNLLVNAWKFTRKTEKARIEFGEKHEDNRRIFFVSDNGAGFDMKYAGNLFIPFTRLHSEKEYPGTGIGLSIVKRVIDRHNGEIWAESEPGKGAAFYFTLGKKVR